jgi:hypothetical protein
VALPKGTPALRGRTIAFVLGELAAGRVETVGRKVPGTSYGAPSLSSVKVPGTLYGAGDAGANQVPGTLYRAGDAGSADQVPGTLYGAADAGANQVPGTLYGAGDAGRDQVPGTLYGAGDAGSDQVPGTLYGASDAAVPDTLYAATPEIPAGDAGLEASFPDAGPPGSPVEFAVIPAFGINALVGNFNRNVFALGLLAERSTFLDGFALAPVSLVDVDTQGLQIGGLAAFTTNAVTGAQLSAGVAWTSTLTGLQLGALSFAGQRADGAQLGVVNLARGLSGVQIGAVNVGWHAGAVQLGAFVSWADELAGGQVGALSYVEGTLTGVQLGVVNRARSVVGGQLGAVNLTGNATGAQLGLVNVAKHVTGLQLGLVNVASSSAVPIGLLNLIEDEPMRVVLRVGSAAFGQAAVRLGGTYLYSFLTAGWTPRSTIRWGGGVGTHLGRGPGWFFEGELSGVSLWTVTTPGSWATQVAVGAEAHVGYQVASRLAIFLGVGGELIFAPPNVGPGLSLIGFALNPTMTAAPLVTLGVVL